MFMRAGLEMDQAYSYSSMVFVGLFVANMFETSHAGGVWRMTW